MNKYTKKKACKKNIHRLKYIYRQRDGRNGGRECDSGGRLHVRYTTLYIERGGAVVRAERWRK